MAVSMEAEIESARIQHPFMIKTAKQPGLEGHSVIVKVTYDKPTPDVVPGGER